MNCTEHYTIKTNLKDKRLTEQSISLSELLKDGWDWCERFDPKGRPYISKGKVYIAHSEGFGREFSTVERG